jgi:serine phosphatase RsbU (regulator of sigma subunit)
MSSSSTVLTRVLLSQLHDKSVDNSLVSMELNYSLFTLLSDKYSRESKETSYMSQYEGHMSSACAPEMPLQCVEKSSLPSRFYRAL